jgi:hypothetical protein
MIFNSALCCIYFKAHDDGYVIAEICSAVGIIRNSHTDGHIDLLS